MYCSQPWGRGHCIHCDCRHLQLNNASEISAVNHFVHLMGVIAENMKDSALQPAQGRKGSVPPVQLGRPLHNMSIEDFDNYFKEGRKIVTVKDTARYLTTCHLCSGWWELLMHRCFFFHAILEINQRSYCTVIKWTSFLQWNEKGFSQNKMET